MGSETNDASMMCDAFSDDPRQGEARIRGLNYEGFDSNGSVRSKGLTPLSRHLECQQQRSQRG